MASNKMVMRRYKKVDEYLKNVSDEKLLLMYNNLEQRLQAGEWLVIHESKLLHHLRKRFRKEEL